MTRTVLTRKEFIIMNTIWKLGKPVSFHDILQADPSINKNTLLAVLHKLEDYGFIEVCGYGYNNTSLTRIFQSRCSQAEYFVSFMDVQQKISMAKTIIPSLTQPASLEDIQSCVQSTLASLDSSGD